MGNFSYSFCVSLFHSLWQSALLFMLYAALSFVIKKQNPSFKRNILYILLLVQFILSVLTFFIYYSGIQHLYTDIIAANFTSLLVEQHFIEAISPWLITAYSCIIVFKIVHLSYHWYQFKMSCGNNLIKPGIDLKVFTNIKANEFGIRRKVTLWFSNAVSTPLTFGFIKPVILMPVALVNQLTTTEAESLIIHELTHIKNNDYLLNLLLIISDTLFFFNPFIKIITGKIKLEREKNCDAQVLQFEYLPVTYAETLFKAAKFRNKANVFQLNAVFKNKQLIRRILFFTAEDNLVFRKRNYSFFCFSAIITALCLNVFILMQVKNKAAETNHPNEEALPSIATLVNTNGLRTLYESYTEQTLKNIESEATRVVEKELPVIQEKIKAMQPLIEMIQEKAAALSTSFAEPNYVIPAALAEANDTRENDTKEVIVNEQSSNGHTVTKAYKMKLKKGIWVAEPLWMITETRSLTDSLSILRDSGMKIIPTVQ